MDVENTGDGARSDVVQVYAHDRSGVALRPRRELVGFAHVTLAPGERRRVEVEVRADDLAFWDVRRHDWALPRGEVDLEVGRSVERIEATLTVRLEGDAVDSAEPPSTPAVAASDAEFSARLGRSIPSPKADRPFTRDSTIGDLSATLVGRGLRAGLRRAMPVSDADRADPATVAMLERSVDELPVRGLAQMSGGRVGWKHVDAVLAFANRRPVAGLRRCSRGAELAARVSSTVPRWARPDTTSSNAGPLVGRRTSRGTRHACP